MGRFFKYVLAVTSFALASHVFGDPIQITWEVDENCNGMGTTEGFPPNTLPCSSIADPGPGGLQNALTYTLGNGAGVLTPGDLILMEGGVISDVIRFEDNVALGTDEPGALVFYSDNADGTDALADTGLPTANLANVLTVTETGAEGNNGFTYTPTAGQPGAFVLGSFAATYIIHSDTSTVPEPATLALLGIGLAGFGFSRRQRKQ